jgi:transposase-like protein
MTTLSAPYFHDEAAAFNELEAMLWPHGPVCPRCGSLDRITAVKGGRMGLRRCGPCKRQFTVTVGTVFESSHIKLNVWLQAVYLICSSKKGISSNQLARVLGLTVKSAWFMSHRIREAMRSGALAPMGGAGAIVEVDETYIGKKAGVPVRRGYSHKQAILTLVERGGQARSFHVDGTSAADIMPILKDNIAAETIIMTDEAGQYRGVKDHFAGHGFTTHSAGEYVKGMIHTNTVEGFYSVFKRGMKGVYQQCGENHLHRYIAEFDFRYNNRVRLGIDDAARTASALKGIVGRRLMYRDSSLAAKS